MEVISLKNMPIFTDFFSADKTKNNSIWSKALSMPLTIYGIVFVINLTKDGNLAITQPPIFATGYVSFATTFCTSTCYLKTSYFLTLH